MKKHLFKSSFIYKFIKSVRNSQIGTFAAQTSFYLVISIFPFLILIISFLKLLNVNLNEIFSMLNIEFDFDYKFNAGIVSVNTILSAWSTGRTFISVKNGFESILGFVSSDNYIKGRVRGILISLLFSFVISLVVVAGMFGEKIINIVFKHKITLINYVDFIAIVRKFFVIAAVFVITYFLYRILPDWNKKDNTYKNLNYNIYLVIVSMIVSVCVYAFTVFFSLYASCYADYNSIYDKMTSLVYVMILIYGSVFLIYFGFKIVVTILNYHCTGISNL